jgi:hypothetical protein
LYRLKFIETNITIFRYSIQMKRIHCFIESSVTLLVSHIPKCGDTHILLWRRRITRGRRGTHTQEIPHLQIPRYVTLLFINEHLTASEQTIITCETKNRQMRWCSRLRDIKRIYKVAKREKKKNMRFLLHG